MNKQPDRSERVSVGRSRDEQQNQPGSEQEDLADGRSPPVDIPFLILILMCLGPVVANDIMIIYTVSIGKSI